MLNSLGIYTAVHAGAGTGIVGTSSAGFLAGTLGTFGATAAAVVSSPFLIVPAVATIVGIAGAEAYCHAG